MTLLERSTQDGGPARTADAAPPDGELIIKEARQRHRRRLAKTVCGVILAAGVAVAAIALLSSNPHYPSGHSPPLATPTTTTPPAAPAASALCAAPQLNVQYRGTQGAAGNFASSFWIANTANTPCSLQSGVSVQILDARGVALSATASIKSPISLSADAVMPPPDQDPETGQVLGVLTIAWPTIANGALTLGATNGECPQALFEPESAHIKFSGVGPIAVDQLVESGVSPASTIPSICGTRFFVWDVGPISAP